MVNTIQIFVIEMIIESNKQTNKKRSSDSNNINVLGTWPTKNLLKILYLFHVSYCIFNRLKSNIILYTQTERTYNIIKLLLLFV